MGDLQTHLTEAWSHNVKTGFVPHGNVGLCATEIAREELLTKKAELERVKLRCHISRVYLGFINRVLAVGS